MTTDPKPPGSGRVVGTLARMAGVSNHLLDDGSAMPRARPVEYVVAIEHADGQWGEIGPRSPTARRLLDRPPVPAAGDDDTVGYAIIHLRADWTARVTWRWAHGKWHGCI